MWKSRDTEKCLRHLLSRQVLQRLGSGFTADDDINTIENELALCDHVAPLAKISAPTERIKFPHLRFPSPCLSFCVGRRSERSIVHGIRKTVPLRYRELSCRAQIEDQCMICLTAKPEKHRVVEMLHDSLFFYELNVFTSTSAPTTWPSDFTGSIATGEEVPLDPSKNTHCVLSDGWPLHTSSI